MMTTLLSLVLIATALTFVFGCIYAAWGVLADLSAGWAQLSSHSLFPRQFKLGALFALTAIVAIACMLVEGVPVRGAAKWIVIFPISLVWAAAIVYGFQCMWAECFRRDSANGPNDCQLNKAKVARIEGSETGVGGPPTDDDLDAELDRWLGERASEEAPKEAVIAHLSSTKETRAHFRVQLPHHPKGVRASGFGRF